MHTSTDEISWKTNLSLIIRELCTVSNLGTSLHCKFVETCFQVNYIVVKTQQLCWHHTLFKVHLLKPFLCFENALHISSMAYKLALTILKFYRIYKLFLLFDRTVNNRWSKILLPLLVTLQERLVTFLWMNIETFHIFLHSSLFLSDSKQLRCFRKSWNTIDSMCMYYLDTLKLYF